MSNRGDFALPAPITGPALVSQVDELTADVVDIAYRVIPRSLAIKQLGSLSALVRDKLHLIKLSKRIPLGHRDSAVKRLSLPVIVDVHDANLAPLRNLTDLGLNAGHWHSFLGR